ncbi:MAG: hypothetical protein AAGI23_22110 [Bacteroidota bacterium]
MYKNLYFFLLLFSINTATTAQTILQALQLKNDSIGEYFESELAANDTLIDIRNGYYEEFMSWGANNHSTIRQAAIFHNDDGTRTLGISITTWDFACLDYKTTFYEIARSKNQITIIPNRELLPILRKSEFVMGTEILTILRKYIPGVRDNAPNAAAALETLLAQFYQIIYRQPRIGTALIATLGFCEYLPDSLGDITEDEWTILENGFGTIELRYDRTAKQFQKEK